MSAAQRERAERVSAEAEDLAADRRLSTDDRRHIRFDLMPEARAVLADIDNDSDR